MISMYPTPYRIPLPVILTVSAIAEIWKMSIMSTGVGLRHPVISLAGFFQSDTIVTFLTCADLCYSELAYSPVVYRKLHLAPQVVPVNFPRISSSHFKFSLHAVLPVHYGSVQSKIQVFVVTALYQKCFIQVLIVNVVLV